MVIKHIGTKRHSGRYPWGSGKDPYQHMDGVRAKVGEARAKGFTETTIAKALGYKSTTDLRKAMSQESAEERAFLYNNIERLSKRGSSVSQIVDTLGISQAKVLYYLNTVKKRQEDSYTTVADNIEKCFSYNKYLDVGKGVNGILGVQKTRFAQALKELENRGYQIHTVKIPNVSDYSAPQIVLKVLAKPGVSWNEIVSNKQDIGIPNIRSSDLGKTFEQIQNPVKVNRNRILVRHAEEGGNNMDGVILLRRGVPDLDLNTTSYAQVRIAVEGNMYMKGMAIYSDDIPKGYDIVYNTAKSRTSTDKDVFKSMSNDPRSPFGSTIERQSGALNIVHEEGHWNTWTQQLSSQFLAKQPAKYITERLDATIKEKERILADINNIPNPTIRKKALIDYSDKLDKNIVSLSAIRSSSTRPQVLLPIQNIKEEQVYAPNFKNGERVVLVRHPHAGVFEIPELVVNNNNKDGRRFLGMTTDAIGIHPNVAKQLSGADFDGDTVLVIPATKNIRTAKPLSELKNFDPKLSFPGGDGTVRMRETQIARQMGVISNLITDMTVKGSHLPEFESDIARAVKHSMVVIDAYKHGLDYKLSEKVHDIKGLQKKYQDGGGVSTLLSRAKSPTFIPERKITGINKETGEYIYTDTKRTRNTKTGLTTVEVSVPKISVTSDIRKLSSGTSVEQQYVDFANKLRSLANSARKTAVDTEDIVYSPAKAKTYADAVNTINAKIKLAESRLPLERMANNLAQIEYAKTKDNIGTDLKKYRASVLSDMRLKLNGKSSKVVLTDYEIEALNSGAISKTGIERILRYVSTDSIYKSSIDQNRSKYNVNRIVGSYAGLKAAGYTNAEIAERFGISVSYLLEITK